MHKMKIEMGKWLLEKITDILCFSNKNFLHEGGELSQLQNQPCLKLSLKGKSVIYA